jgi:hypothetical protein
VESEAVATGAAVGSTVVAAEVVACRRGVSIEGNLKVVVKMGRVGEDGGTTAGAPEKWDICD